MQKGIAGIPEHTKAYSCKSTFALHLVLKNAHTGKRQNQNDQGKYRGIDKHRNSPYGVYFKGFPKTGTLWIPGEAELLSVTAIRISNEVLALKVNILF